MKERLIFLKMICEVLLPHILMVNLSCVLVGIDILVLFRNAFLLANFTISIELLPTHQPILE